MTSAVSYRKATPADRDAIWQVRSASIRGLCTNHYGEQVTELWASAPAPDDFAAVICGREFIVAEHESIIVGFGFLNQDTGELEALFVAPQSARRGVGTAILTSLEAIARQAGLQHITLSASLNSLRFYESAGYRAVQETAWQHPAGFILPCVAMAKDL